ncbi:MAG: hypothetical protein KatS3mg103_1229 [Phycisphaerales bacterium]|nr:MAG: hypothetical protein KatS3mg103_1229 [Phycisphaerales bacterium]
MGQPRTQARCRPWASPLVRSARLGGLCVVAAAGLLAAGGLAAAQPATVARWMVLALVALPAMALAALALHRFSRRAGRAMEPAGRADRG